ncbi:MAG TPA: tetratricopeptide repeat protein [Vicinamibacterales bacterium]|nr:tetratricopeptide repeat protein [Vicinamibacterales bacterium]
MILWVLLAAALATPPPPQAAGADRATLLAGASAALAAGRRDEALSLLQQAADRFGSVQALLQIAQLDAANHDGRAALASLARARTLAPNSEEVLSAVAQASLAARLPLPAAAALEALTRMCPDVAQYHYLFGVTLMAAGDMPHAVEELKQADVREPHRSLTLAALGLALNSQKQFTDAKGVLTESLALDPDRPETIAALAESEAALGDIAAAERDAQRALTRSPQDPTANLVLGEIRLQQGRYDEAREALLKAAAADPHSPKPDYQLSLVYARLGDTANAQRSIDSYQRKQKEMEAQITALRRTRLPGTDSRAGGR